MFKIISLGIFVATLASFDVNQGSPIIIAPFDINSLPYSQSFSVYCVVDPAVDLSSVIWSKISSKSTKLIYKYDGSKGSIIPEPPSNSTWKYRVQEIYEQERRFYLEVNDKSFTDAGIYECRVESNGFVYIGQAKVAIYGAPKMTLTPKEVLDNHVYNVECSIEVAVASINTDYMRVVTPSIGLIEIVPLGLPISESPTRFDGFETFEEAPLVMHKNITLRANHQNQYLMFCFGDYYNKGSMHNPPFRVTEDLTITIVPKSSVIISGPKDTYASTWNPLWCIVNETAEISSLTWSNTFANSTELIYFYDGSKGTIVPEPPSNSTSKYRVDEQDRKFILDVYSVSFTDVGIYKCQVESDGVIYTEQAKFSLYGRPKITQTPEDVPDNRLYSVECSIEVGVASVDPDYINSIQPSINNLYLSPTYKPISESQTWVDGLKTSEDQALLVWRKNITVRASYQDQLRAYCNFTNLGYTSEVTEDVRISRNPVIIKGPDNRFPRALEPSTVFLECRVNEYANISFVTWSKTFLGSTELIYTFDGNEGKINPAPPPTLTWKYRVLESHKEENNFTLEIRNITLSDVGNYECTVESNGQNYTEQANMSVYGSPRLTQIPQSVQNGEWNYTFLCSVEVAISSNSSELITSAKPNITAWYMSSDIVYLHPRSSEWTGIDPFGNVHPVYTEEYFVLGQADYSNPYFLGCTFSTPDSEVLHAFQWTNFAGNPELKVITKGPENHFPRAQESSTILLECQVNEAADISLVTWSKTFLGSTELIYTYDGKGGKIFPPPPSNSTWKYRVRESHEEDWNFALEIANITLLDVGTYECAVESNGLKYTEQADVSVYGSSRITQIPEIVHEGESYNFICSLEIALVGNSSELIKSVLPTINAWYRLNLSSDPVALNSLGSEWTGLDPFGEILPIYTEDYHVAGPAEYDNPYFLGCTFSSPECETFNAFQWTHIAGNPAINVITKGPESRFPSAVESPTILLECQVNEAADISLVTWSKTFLGSTELIYTYDGNEGKIISPTPSNSPWKYRVRESHEEDWNFHLEIADITLLDVGTYECTVESNGRNYTEEAYMSVYGSSRMTQIPDMVLQGETYDFRCSVEVALVDNSSELIKSVLPTIAASYRPDITSDPIPLSSLGSEWTGLDSFGEFIPVYTAHYHIADPADNDNQHFLQCTCSTPEGEMFHELQFTHVGVPVKDVEVTPTGSRFYPGDEITCSAYGRPEISSYQWFHNQELSAPRVEGQVLILRDADLGNNTLTCVAKNYINSIEYSSSKSKSFTVVANGDTRPGPQPVALLLAFSVAFLGI